MDSTTDCQSILASRPIQIVHIHPDTAYKRRTDLDVEVFVAESYPLELADKILNFLPKLVLGSKRAGTRLERTSKRTKIKEGQFKAPEQPKKTVRWADQAFRAPDFLQSVTPLRISPSTLLPSSFRHDRRLSIPLRPAVQLRSFSTISSAVSTARTITPGGTVFPSLRAYDNDQSPTRVPRPGNVPPNGTFTPSRQACVAQKESRFLPALATPNSAPVVTSLQAANTPAVNTSRISKAENPPNLIVFQQGVRSINGNPEMPTVVLRHRVEPETLRNVFSWCKRSAEIGRIESLEGWLVTFRDRERVKDIMEVCVIFGLDAMKRECERTIAKFERFGQTLTIGSGRQETECSLRETDAQSDASGGSYQYRDSTEDFRHGRRRIGDEM